MSKKNRRKKVRNPSPEAVSDFVKKRQEQLADEQARREANAAAQAAEADKQHPDETPDQRQRRKEKEYLDNLSPEERDSWVEAGRLIHERMTTLYLRPDGPMTQDEVVTSLDTCTRFLTQLVDCASDVMGSLDANSIRKIVAADVPLTETMRLSLRALGLASDKFSQDTVEEVYSSPQQRPRGARHPLMSFFAMAVQAARLVCQITRGAWPEAHNLFTRKEKIEKHEDRHGIAAKLDTSLKKLERLKT